MPATPRVQDEPLPAPGALRWWTADWTGWVLAAAAAWTAVFYGALRGRGGSPLLWDLADLPTHFAAALLAWVNSRHTGLAPRSRRAWRWLSLALVALLIGNVVYIATERLLGLNPFPSAADLAFVAFLPLLLTGLLTCHEAIASRLERLKFALDSLTITFGAGAVLWLFLLRPVALAAQRGHLELLLAGLYPLGDAIALFATVVALSSRPPRVRMRVLLLILPALGCLFVGDASFALRQLAGVYGAAHWTDSLWAWFSVLVMAAAHGHRANASADREPRVGGLTPGFGLLPYASIALAYGALLWLTRDHWGEPLGMLVFASAGLIAAALTRRAVAARESARLLEERATREVAAREAADVASRVKSEFLAAMSHELRTPMNGILGTADLLLGSHLSQAQRRLAELLRGSAESLLGMIDEVLDFSRMEAGQLGLEHADFAPGTLVEDVAELLAERAQTKGVELVVDLGDGLPSVVRGDAGRLRQILLNLAGNGVKFTERGEVVLTAFRSGGSAGAPLLRFEVRDTGIGVPPDAAERIFDPFRQADGSLARRFGGTGLGLAICRRLAELMCGTVGFTSTPGVGSTFWVEVPFAAGSVKTAVPTHPPVPPGRRALVDDDNAASRDALARRLSRCGLEVETAEGGASAVRRLRTAASHGTAFEVAFVDVSLPRVSSGSAGEREAEQGGGDTAVNRRGEPPPLAGRVLLVEDNEVNRLVAQAMLEGLGLQVEIAQDGESALQALAAAPFDAVLMDCMLPGVDGFEATRRWRETERERRSARLPVIALTAKAVRGDRDACLAAGMDDYLSKPCRPEDLRTVLARWIGRKTLPGSSSPPAAGFGVAS